MQACNDYYEDHGHLPLHEGMTADHGQLSDNQLMSILVGLDSALDKNPTGTAYFKYKKASGEEGEKYNGLDRDENFARLYGPWKTQTIEARFYHLIMDYDNNEIIDEPSNLGNKRITGKRVLVYHMGKDGQIGPGRNDDNVYSYQ